MLMLLAKFEFDGWFFFFQKQGIIKKIGFPLKQMCMNGKVNQGPLHDIKGQFHCNGITIQRNFGSNLTHCG